MFVLGVPVYRQRFLCPVSAGSMVSFCRLCRASCAVVEHLCEPFAGDIECDETTFVGAHTGKRGWGAFGKSVFGII
jgi:hypothetical protein